MAEEKRCDINNASADEIARVCDVVPDATVQIVQTRSKKRFDSIDEITDLPGIGGTTVDRMKQHGCYAG